MTWLSRYPPAHRLPVRGRHRRPHHSDFRAGEHAARRADARGGHLRRRSPRCSAPPRRRDRRRAGRPGRTTSRCSRCGSENERAATRRSRSCAIGLQQERALAQQSRDAPGAARAADAASSCRTTAAAGHRQRREPRVPDDHHRQGHGDGLRRRHGGDRAGGVVGRIIMPSRAGVEGSAADRPQRGGRRAGRAVAGAGVVVGTAPSVGLRHGLRVRHGRRQGWRPRGDLRHRRHLP